MLRAIFLSVFSLMFLFAPTALAKAVVAQEQEAVEEAAPADQCFGTEESNGTVSLTTQQAEEFFSTIDALRTGNSTVARTTAMMGSLQSCEDFYNEHIGHRTGWPSGESCSNASSQCYTDWQAGWCTNYYRCKCVIPEGKRRGRMVCKWDRPPRRW